MPKNKEDALFTPLYPHMASKKHSIAPSMHLALMKGL